MTNCGPLHTWVNTGIAFWLIFISGFCMGFVVNGITFLTFGKWWRRKVGKWLGHEEPR